MESAKALLRAEVLPWGEEVLHAALLIKDSSGLATTSVTWPTEGGRVVELAEVTCQNVAALATAL